MPTFIALFALASVLAGANAQADEPKFTNLMGKTTTSLTEPLLNLKRVQALYKNSAAMISAPWEEAG